MILIKIPLCSTIISIFVAYYVVMSKDETMMIVLHRGILIKIIQVIGHIDLQHTCGMHNNGIIHPKCKGIGRNNFALCTYGTLIKIVVISRFLMGFTHWSFIGF